MFRRVRSLQVANLLIILCCCAAAQKVKTGYDKATDFSKYKTYTWAIPDRPSTRPLLREHVIGCVDDELKSKGLQRVEQGGDLTVVASGGVGFDTNLPAGAPIIPAYGGAPISMDATMWTGSGIGAGASGPLVSEGTLGIDLVDAAATKLVWRGMVTEKFDIEKKNEALQRVAKAVTKLFKDYPPKKS
jgi:hypothetical protein